MTSTNFLDSKSTNKSFSDEIRIESFSEYIDRYWVERKRFQFAYDSEQIRNKTT